MTYQYSVKRFSIKKCKTKNQTETKVKKYFTAKMCKNLTIEKLDNWQFAPIPGVLKGLRATGISFEN